MARKRIIIHVVRLFSTLRSDQFDFQTTGEENFRRARDIEKKGRWMDSSYKYLTCTEMKEHIYEIKT